ncbi:DUF1014-domain-containing protein [Russula earlei]|uniref:DUF1014-domain-containing protein n=1 Tax=Russula earlei TaxID=71964 RepID=A0ACC0U4M3_9AGAM|nr:DUF1014-domain-containing protein [Russula earlei]
MAPKGENTKTVSARRQKVENEKLKREKAEEAKDRAEADKWKEGARSTKAKDEKKDRDALVARRKAENARLLAEEEASADQAKKASPKAGTKKAAAGARAKQRAGHGEVVAPAVSAETSNKSDSGPSQDIESFSATGIDNALDLLEVVTAKMDKASVGNQAATIEKHPERRFKAAFNAYVDRELPNIRAEQPGLRLQQYKDLLFKQFQKSPENPFNQTTVEYNATTEEKVDALYRKQDEIRERLRE